MLVVNIIISTEVIKRSCQQLLEHYPDLGIVNYRLICITYCHTVQQTFQNIEQCKGLI